MTVAYIIGNGKSRSYFNLEKLRGSGTIYGCNALYRVFKPDFLVAIDDGIISEIECSEFPSKQVIIPPMDERWEPAECNPNRPRSNAGMNAMREAIKRDAKTIIALGFDFLINNPNASVSNVFDGTKNYGPETRASYHDNPGRMNYLRWLISKHPSTEFFFVFPKETPLTKTINYNNIFFITYDTLTKNLHT